MADVRELCDRHGYPDALRAVLEGVVEAARSEIPGLHALVLSGSVATGDFVWREADAGVRLLSDVDVLAFARRGGPHARFSAAVAALVAPHASFLFHVDVSISGVRALGSIPPRYQFVEARAAGVAPIGPEVLDAFPDRFDPRASRQSLFGNVWKGVASWPGTASDDEVYRLALARMILDLPTLAFAEQGRCVVGHGGRAEAFARLGDGHPLSTGAARRAVTAAMRMRQHGDVARGELEAFARNALDAALHFLDRAGPAGPASRELARRIRRLLPPRGARRALGELRALLRDPVLLRSDPAWWLRRKEAVGAAALIGLFDFALGGVKGVPTDQTSSLLRAFSGGREPSGEAAAYLDSARHVYWEGRRRLYPSDAEKPSTAHGVAIGATG